MSLRGDNTEDTIVAMATAAGRASVGIIRISGNKALEIGLLLTQGECKEFVPRQAMYTAIKDREGALIDRAILIYFKAPHSFTGEDVIEIQGHGAPVLLDYILQESLQLGARIARPGEFSERAFLNNKMDLAQAEAVADLIAAHSMKAAKMALRSLEGDFSEIIKKLSEDIIQLRLFVEAAIDFPDEDIHFLKHANIDAKISALLDTIQEICDITKQGVLIREGLSIVIAGKPNAGKSTLINRLAGRELAIVTEVAGTTRDVMREYIAIDEMPVHIVDTAGLRESEDRVEQEGIKRAWQEVANADCVLMMMDLNDGSAADDALTKAIEKQIAKGTPIIKVMNKLDLSASNKPKDERAVYISAKRGDGMDALKKAIKSAVGFNPMEGKFLARRRHLSALQTAKAHLLAGKKQLETVPAIELLAEDLRLSHLALCDITGEFSSDDLLGEIFSSFCIGK